MSLFEILRDPDNFDTIHMTDENGEKIAFDPLAMVEYDSNEYLVAQIHSDEEDDEGDNEVFIFALTVIDGEEALVPEEDDEIADIVFEEFLAQSEATEE